MITPIFQNSNENIVGISALQFFEASWGLLGRFLGLPGDLVSNIINKEAYRKLQKYSRKPKGSHKNFQGRNPYNIFIAILENRCPHRFILSLTDLYLLLSNSQVTSLISKQFNSRHYSVAIFFGEQNFCSNSLEIQTLSTSFFL